MGSNYSTVTIRSQYTVPRYNMKCIGENVIIRGIVHVVSRFPLHFMLCCGYLDFFSNRVKPQSKSPPSPLHVHCTLYSLHVQRSVGIGELKLWDGYSLLYVEGNEKSHHQDLGKDTIN